MTPQEAYEKRYAPEKFAEAPQEIKDAWLAAWTISWAIAEQMEREACARVCESLSCEWEHQPNILQAEQATMRECAAAIRNRA